MLARRSGYTNGSHSNGTVRMAATTSDELAPLRASLELISHCQRAPLDTARSSVELARCGARCILQATVRLADTRIVAARLWGCLCASEAAQAQRKCIARNAVPTYSGIGRRLAFAHRRCC